MDKVPFSHIWQEHLLGDLADVIVGGTPSTAVPRYWHGDIPWMSSGEVHKKRISEVSGRITTDGLNSSNAKLVEPPAVAIALAGQGKTRGTVAITQVPVCTNQSVALIKPFSQDLDASYLFHSLDFRYEELRGRSDGAGRAGLNKQLIEAIPIPVPEINEQLYIAEVLDTIDLSITHTENLIAKYQRIKTGLMQDLLTRGIDEHGQLRDPKTHKFKSSPFGLIPEDWKLVKLGDIIAESQGMIQTGPFGSQLHAHEYTSEGIPVIMPQDIGDDGKLLIEQAAKISQTRANDLKRHILKANDVIFARRGDLSRCASIKPEQHGLCGSGCMLLRVSEDVLSGDWMSITYRYTFCQRQIAAQAVGSTMVNLNTQILANLLLPKPSIQEQRLVSKSILEFHAFLETKEFLLQKLMNLKNGLMQDLLTGEVPVEPLLTN